VWYTHTHTNIYIYSLEGHKGAETERGGACSSNEEKRNAYKLVGKPEGRRPIRKKNT
jgi:hypothetical protein